MLSPSPLDIPFKSVEPQPAPARRRTLLIVDDEEGPRQSLKIVFMDEYNILLAEDGAQAVELARQHAIDAAVLDIRMGGMSGIELLERLKAIDPAVEVIMLTAYETIETARQALRLGACDYLNKPFDLSTIRAAVATAMERRSLSEEIRANNQRLLELQAEIRGQKLQEQLARTRGEIYASIVHDINGPLTVISGFIEIINQHLANAKRIEGEDLAIVRDRLARITRQVNNCIDISRRYLQFLRQRSQETTGVGVNQILADLDELLKLHPSARGHQLIVHALAQDLQTRVNSTDFIQILLNLAINALQCTTLPHQVEVDAQPLGQALDQARFAEGPQCRFLNGEGFQNTPPLLALRVRDNGPGIPAEVLPRVFEPYFSTKPPGQGTGLGLSIVARLVKEARGAVCVQTEFGRGTTFTVYLPVL
ncbi:MAG: response regulator [Verrucomicrobia bacterium]|nr:response regulator [Verrucomicrobiota bacterium]